MIRTQEEYNNACNFINSDMELYDFILSEKMSSYEYNLYLQDTEYFLNFLYEKIRTLEELCDYLDNYIETKFYNAKKKLETNLDLVEKVSFIYDSDKTTDIVPEWNFTKSDHLTDRNGAEIQNTIESAETIGPATRKENQIIPQLFTKKENNLAYYDNIDSSIQDGYYLVCYQKSKYQNIAEAVDINLPANADYNCIDIDPINCKLLIEKTDAGVSVTMYPERYDKELRNFDFRPYTGSALCRFAAEPTKYRPKSAIVNNQQTVNNSYNLRRKDRYVSDTIYAQEIEKHNNSKAAGKI